MIFVSGDVDRLQPLHMRLLRHILWFVWREPKRPDRRPGYVDLRIR